MRWKKRFAAAAARGGARRGGLLGAALALLLVITWPRTGTAESLRVVTFNMAMGKVLDAVPGSNAHGAFGHRRHLRQADILALQEVCLNDPRQLRLFLKVIGRDGDIAYHFSDYAETRRGMPCDKGQAIVSRLPIVAAGRLRLPRVGAERVAIWADIDLGARLPDAEEVSHRDRLRVYNVHLSNRAGRNLSPLEGRRRQAARVLDHARLFRLERPGAPVLLVGDFNTANNLLVPWDEELAIADIKRTFRASLEGFVPTMLIPYKMDWIFYSGLNLRASHVVPLLHSDHFPVMADFDLAQRRR